MYVIEGEVRVTKIREVALATLTAQMETHRYQKYASRLTLFIIDIFYNLFEALG